MVRILKDAPIRGVRWTRSRDRSGASGWLWCGERTPRRSSKSASSYTPSASLVPADCIGARKFVEIALEEAMALLDAIEPTLVAGAEPAFDWAAMRALLQYYAERSHKRVLVLAEKGRKLSKLASGDRSGLSILGTADLRALVREPTRIAPAIVLLEQIGGPDLGWKAGPFWWPMLASPPQASSCVFATRVAA